MWYKHHFYANNYQFMAFEVRVPMPKIAFFANFTQVSGTLEFLVLKNSRSVSNVHYACPDAYPVLLWDALITFQHCFFF